MKKVREVTIRNKLTSQVSQVRNYLVFLLLQKSDEMLPGTCEVLFIGGEL